MTQEPPLPPLAENELVAYGWRDRAWVKKIFRFCSERGFVPSLMFTIKGNGRYICAVSARGDRMYLRVLDFRRPNFDATRRPEFLSRRLANETQQAWRKHALAPSYPPLKLRIVNAQ